MLNVGEAPEGNFEMFKVKRFDILTRVQTLSDGCWIDVIPIADGTHYMLVEVSDSDTMNRHR